MSKIVIPPEKFGYGRDICCGCKYYVDKDDWSADYICVFGLANGLSEHKISEYECTGFEPNVYAQSHWQILEKADRKVSHD